MPKVSVIVPVYRTESYIDRCVDSILAQTFNDLELILVDDGSSDNCSSICDAYTLLDPRVKVIHKKNSGQATARNHAIFLCEGEWVTFVDSDDFINSKMIEHLVCEAEKNKVNISACSFVTGDEASADFFNEPVLPAEIYEMSEKTIIEMSEYSVFLHTVWGKLISKNILSDILFDEDHFYEDTAIVCKWVYASGSIALSQSNLYFYQVNPIGTTKSGFSEKKLDQIWAWGKRADFYNEVGYYTLRKMALYEYYTYWSKYYFEAYKKYGKTEKSVTCKKELFHHYFKYFNISKSTLYFSKIIITGYFKFLFSKDKK